MYKHLALKHFDRKIKTTRHSHPVARTRAETISDENSTSVIVPRHLPRLKSGIGEFSLNKSPIVARHWLKMGYQDPIPVYPKCNENEGLTNQVNISRSNLNNCSSAKAQFSVKSNVNEGLTNQSNIT